MKAQKMERIMKRIRLFISRVLGLTDAYQRIMQLEIELAKLKSDVTSLKDFNIPLITAEVESLKIEADIINKKIK
jgi:hypothetical protein